MSLADPPDPDELEVSLFGPGVGECVVAHLGAGEWMVVDSCLNPTTRTPVALEYLAEVGVAPATAITHVVVSHWHDDHTRGVSEVLEASTGARLVCSAALRRDELKQLIAAGQDVHLMAGGTSGVKEIHRALGIARARRAGTAGRAGPAWAQADMRLHSRPASAVANGCEVWALSPSSHALTRSFHDIARLLPQVGAVRRAAVNVGPNDTSVVLGVRLGDAIVVLGSDLEAGSAPDLGWGAVVATSALLPSRGHALKVPHHGSQNAYHPGQWSTLMGHEAVALLTPFTRGKTALPTDADIARLKEHTAQVYCTSRAPGKATFSDPVVARTVGEVARVARYRTSQLGHVRVRIPSSGAGPRVERFGAAFAA